MASAFKLLFLSFSQHKIRCFSRFFHRRHICGRHSVWTRFRKKPRSNRYRRKKKRKPERGLKSTEKRSLQRPIVINFAVLFALKYYNFTVTNIASLMGAFGLEFSPCFQSFYCLSEFHSILFRSRAISSTYTAGCTALSAIF